jgi:hypothetical protein
MSKDVVWSLRRAMNPKALWYFIDSNYVPDSNTRLIQLKGGQAQVIETVPFSLVAATRASGYNVSLFPSTDVNYYAFNHVLAGPSGAHLLGTDDLDVVGQAVTFAMSDIVLTILGIVCAGCVRAGPHPGAVRRHHRAA